MAPPSFDETMAEIAEQHRRLFEAHRRWVDHVTSAAVQDLATENERLSAELSAMRSFILKRRPDEKSPPMPKLPASFAHAPPAQAAPMLDRSFALPPPLAVAQEQLQKTSDTGPLEHSDELETVADLSRDLPGMVAPPIGEGRARRATQNGKKHASLQYLAMATDRDTKAEAKERRRFRIMFNLQPGETEVPLDTLSEAVMRRLPRNRISWLAMPESPKGIAAEVLSTLLAFKDGSAGVAGEVLAALRAIEAARKAIKHTAGAHFWESWLSDTGFALDGLVQLAGPDMSLLMQNVALEDEENVHKFVQALQVTTADELVEEASRGTHHVELKEAKSNKERFASIVNAAVVGVVLVNVLLMGVSIDYNPEHKGWVALEAMCVAVFVFEAAFKVWAYGLRSYVLGPAGYWNMLDAFITSLTILELGMSIAILVYGSSGKSDESTISSLTRPMVFMRTLRAIRVIRLAKLLHSPFLRDLANMFACFAIGVPALIWVLAVFGFVLYILGLIFRLLLGPAPGQDLIFLQGCGWGDDLTSFDDDLCKVHWIYGEEFFGDVSSSMFTVFRFMLGDYSTRGGKSMIVALSYGYGSAFEVVFVMFMIIVIFGLFNIITAIFVDSTTTGLKHNDTKRKCAQQYEREFVKTKLHRLVERIRHLVEESPSLCPRVRTRETFDDVRSLVLEEEAFTTIVRDSIVQDIMGELDVTMYNPAGMFDTFDADGDGVVSMLEFVQVIMKLRGEPHKTDIIGCAVSIRSLQDGFDELNAKLKMLLEVGPATSHDMSGGTTTGSTC